ncbi:MAG TPA: NAD-dependent epimerase/dehydratase family protein, partial [Candidatus Thermoplasmatota archaeon]|nr:NAD-dependent epimerase/dehydratase family protein [Candidatus Thermoplasmatota archaeon]
MHLQGKRAFVTGATGFLGPYLVEALLKRGAQVTALVRRPISPEAKALAAKGATLVEGDVTEVTTLEARGCDVFFHNAAVVGHGLTKRLRRHLFEVNVEGTRNALSAARRAGITRFVHTSSIAVIGDTRGEVADEGFPRNPWFRSYYEQSKLEAHLLVMGAEDLNPVLPMRPFGRRQSQVFA